MNLNFFFFDFPKKWVDRVMGDETLYWNDLNMLTFNFNGLMPFNTVPAKLCKPINECDRC